MLALTTGQTGASVSPVYAQDLRPTADAAATRHQAEPAVPVSVPPAALLPPVAPPSAAARAEMGRSLLAAVAVTGSNIQGGDERRLKPWGIAMLPAEQPKVDAGEQAQDATATGPSPALDPAGGNSDIPDQV